MEADVCARPATQSQHDADEEVNAIDKTSEQTNQQNVELKLKGKCRRFRDYFI